MIVGISGASCSGKTSLAKALATRLDAPMIHLDQYFIPEAERPLVRGYPSFEQPHQYDARAMYRDLIDMAGTSKNIVIEGFLLFTYPGFRETCDQRIHLDVPHHVLVQRRANRHGATGDVKGGRIKMADTGWANHGRDEWERYGNAQSFMPGIQVLRPYDEEPKPSAEELANRLVTSFNL